MIYDLMVLGIKRLPGAECDLNARTLHYWGPRWWARELALQGNS